MGPRGRGRAQGVGRAPDPRGQVPDPPAVFSVPNILKYSRKKIIFKFKGIWRTFIFGVFLYCMDNQITDRKLFIFTLFQLNNRKYIEGMEGCASSFIHLMLIKRNPLTRLIKSC